MKRFLFCCAFLWASFTAQSQEAASRLVQPTGTSLKLVDLRNTQELRAEFSGAVWIEGTLIVEWTDGSERAANPAPEYRIVPKATSKARLPYFVVNDPPYRNSYKVRSIEIENGDEALLLAIGREAAERFIEQKRSVVRVTGRFQLEAFSVGVECDAAWAKAKVLRVQLPKNGAKSQTTSEGC